MYDSESDISGNKAVLFCSITELSPSVRYQGLLNLVLDWERWDYLKSKIPIL